MGILLIMIQQHVQYSTVIIIVIIIIIIIIIRITICIETTLQLDEYHYSYHE